MTMNTALIDFMNKCLIDLSPDFSCISISKILISLFFSSIITLIVLVMAMKSNKPKDI